MDPDHPLLGAAPLDEAAEVHLARAGRVFAAFRQQDSACHAWGVEVAGERWFVKAPVDPRGVPSLERAIRFHRAVRHPAIIALRHVLATPDGPALVYPWVDGEVLYPAPGGGAAARLDPASPHARFRALPVPEVLAALDAIFDAHLAVAAAGYVEVDLYDGSIIYDFAARRVHLCDFDEYRPGPFTVAGPRGRLPGSLRFLAPEQLTAGGVVDERTTVHTLGRTALILLDEGDLSGAFRAGAACLAVARLASAPDPPSRYPTVASFVTAWRQVATPGAAFTR